MRANTDWFKDARWGVMLHYLAERYFDEPESATAEQWNDLVDNVDVEVLAEQLASVNAAYCLMTLGQNSGHWCAPNATYDSIVGISPSKCSQRDLVSDLYEALQRRGIKLMVYMPSGAPEKDVAACAALEWRNGKYPEHRFVDGLGPDGQKDDRLADFQLKWEAVITEWSQRWGTKICGWWFDGCYFADAMYRHKDAPNFNSFAQAAKAGNGESIVAFSPGVYPRVISLSEYEDYTGGEIDHALPVAQKLAPLGRWVDGAQYHILSFLGDQWGMGDKPRFSDELAAGFTGHINDHAGVVTWDVPITKDGRIPEPFLKQLATL